MVRITVEVGRGAARYRIAVQAESIRGALEFVERWNPGDVFRMTFPVDPETFFVKDPTAKVGLVELERAAA